MQTANASTMQRVNVCGADLEACNADGLVHVSVKRVCEALGIDDDAQRVKLQNQPWAATLMIKATAPDGKKYEAFCIELDSLPMWLATIHAGKVKPEARARLVAFQCEAKRVLADHFFGRMRSADTSTLLALVTEQREQFAMAMAVVQNELAIIRAEQSRSQFNTGIIGYELAERYLARIRLIADCWVNQKRARNRRSAIAAIRQNLVAAIGYGGTGKRLAFMPTSLRGELDAALTIMERDVHRADSAKALPAPKPEQAAMPWGVN